MKLVTKITTFKKKKPLKNTHENVCDQIKLGNGISTVGLILG